MRQGTKGTLQVDPQIYLGSTMGSQDLGYAPNEKPNLFGAAQQLSSQFRASADASSPFLSFFLT